MKLKRIILSRTDSIGDVVLTLPLAGAIKKYFPQAEIIFFGSTYTRDVISSCVHVNEFLNYDEFKLLDASGKKKFLQLARADAIIHVFPRRDIATSAAAAKIPNRIGTSHRMYHWLTCNRLISLGRKNSGLHEAQLNLSLLKKIGIGETFSLQQIPSLYGFSRFGNLPPALGEILSPGKKNVILHPASQSSAREWTQENFLRLIWLLDESRFNIIITGTEKDLSACDEWIKKIPAHVHNLMGKMQLAELISFIAASDALVAASTGPLHLAAAAGKKAIGIFAPIRPMHPGRWAPLGEHAIALCVSKTCSDCARDETQCHCINEIKPEQVLAELICS